MQVGTETTSDPATQGTPATDANRIPQDLPLPSPNDDPPTLLAKLTTVVAIVSDDRSICSSNRGATDVDLTTRCWKSGFGSDAALGT
jgi:hypothetical protein